MYASLSVRGLVEIAQDEEGTEETVTLYGWDGEKIFRKRYEWEALKDVRSMYYCGMDEENIYCEYMVRTGEKEELAVTAFPLDGSDMKILWRGNEDGAEE